VCPPRAETTADGLGWLLYAPRMLGGTKAARDDGGRHG
jgi:hypothetical protein